MCTGGGCAYTFIYFIPFRNAANHHLHVILCVILPLNPAHRISVKLWWPAWQLEPEDGTSDQKHHHCQSHNIHHHQSHNIWNYTEGPLHLEFSLYGSWLASITQIGVDIYWGWVKKRIALLVIFHTTKQLPPLCDTISWFLIKKDLVLIADYSWSYIEEASKGELADRGSSDNLDHPTNWLVAARWPLARKQRMLFAD